jgi:hypothetical protein
MDSRPMHLKVKIVRKKKRKKKIESTQSPRKSVSSESRSVGVCDIFYLWFESSRDQRSWISHEQIESLVHESLYLASVRLRIFIILSEI